MEIWETGQPIDKQDVLQGSLPHYCRMLRGKREMMVLASILTLFIFIFSDYLLSYYFPDVTETQPQVIPQDAWASEVCISPERPP